MLLTSWMLSKILSKYIKAYGSYGVRNELLKNEGDNYKRKTGRVAYCTRHTYMPIQSSLPKMINKALPHHHHHYHHKKKSLRGEPNADESDSCRFCMLHSHLRSPTSLPISIEILRTQWESWHVHAVSQKYHQGAKTIQGRKQELSILHETCLVNPTYLPTK